MRKYILVLVLLLTANSFISSQNKMSVNFGSGYYLSNSENTLKIMDDKKFRTYLVYGFTYQRENLFSYNLMVEYSYHQIIKKDVIEFITYNSSSPEPIGIIYGDMSLISHNIDFDYVANINEYFSYGIGPAIVITSRILEIEDNVFEESNSSLYDKLASAGLGINAFFEVTYPLTESKNFFFITSKLKLRYTHSTWFDEGLRNLDNYSQEFITTQFSIGIGYSF